MLTSDELGEKGESRFREICADAKLICNKADRDRTGWDFIVEFPFGDKDEKTTLDGRTTPFSCHVQVKTLLKSTSDFQMRLSSAERLAKEQKPSFVYVFKVDEKLEFSDAFLVHLFDDRLGMILKRLRLEEAKGTPAKKLNKKSISLTPRVMERLEPTGPALFSALKSVCPDSPHAYAAKKKEQLEKLGFEPRPYEGTMTLHLNSNEDIADVFLGLKKVPVSNFSTFQNRFGIKLPQQTAMEGLITIQPDRFDECLIIIKRDPLAIPAVFNADLFLPLIPLSLGKKKCLLVNPLFTMVIEPEGKITRFTVTYKTESQNMPANVWADFWRMILAFSAGQGTIEVRAKKMPAEISLDITQPDGPSVEYCEFFIDLCERVSDLVKRVGLSSAPKLSLQEIESNAQEIVLASALIKGESPSISFKVTRTNELEKIEAERLIFAKILFLGNVAIAYYGMIRFSAKVEGDEILLESTEFSPGAIKVMRNIHDDFDAFVEKASVIEKTANVIRFETESVDCHQL